MSGIRLDQIRPVTRHGGPKGYVPYHPKQATRLLVGRITGLYDALREQDALPAGPRTIGYRLKEVYRGQYAKKDFGAIGETIKRLCQAGVLSFEDVSDASAVTHDPGGWDDMAAFLWQVPGFYRRDLRSGQPVVTEVITEAKETLGLISRLGRERGVLVYSGSGSSGPGLARKVALRALKRAVEHGQDTLLIGLGDFDQAGIANIQRPHAEHLAAFLYGLLPGCDAVLSYEGKVMADTGCTARFWHLGLSPEMALERAELAELDDLDQRAIAAYAASGDELWSRDLALLDGVARFELEAVNPPDLRSLVTDALDRTLDRSQLEAIAAKGQMQREILAARLAALASEDEDGDGEP
jgi:hypothetical protein